MLVGGEVGLGVQVAVGTGVRLGVLVGTSDAVDDGAIVAVAFAVAVAAGVVAVTVADGCVVGPGAHATIAESNTSANEAYFMSCSVQNRASAIVRLLLSRSQSGSSGADVCFDPPFFASPGFFWEDLCMNWGAALHLLSQDPKGLAGNPSGLVYRANSMMGMHAHYYQIGPTL